MTSILLVDDSATILMSMSSILGRAGYQVEQAESGEAAMGKLKGGIAPKLIITDFNMPGMNGAQLIGEARKLPAFGGDDGIKFGFNCGTSAGKHVIVAHRFMRGTNGKWKRRNLRFVWQGGDLMRSGKASYKILSGSPPSKQTGIGC